MGMKACKECGEQVSTKAKSCPKCGAMAKKGTSLFTWLVALLVVLWIAGYLPSIDTTYRPATSSASPRQQEFLEPNLEVISWKCEKEHSYVFVVGEVKNISSEKMKNVMAVGEFRTKSGVLVKSEDSIIQYNPILPGQTSPFKTGSTDNPQIKSCHLSFTTLFGKTIRYITAKDRIIKAQELLSEIGYQVGKPDGIMGKKTRSAINKFQFEKGLKKTGKVSRQLISELLKAKKRKDS